MSLVGAVVGVHSGTGWCWIFSFFCVFALRVAGCVCVVCVCAACCVRRVVCGVLCVCVCVCICVEQLAQLATRSAKTKQQTKKCYYFLCPERELNSAPFVTFLSSLGGLLYIVL